MLETAFPQQFLASDKKELENALKTMVENSIVRFPQIFNEQLLKGFYRLIANAPNSFLIQRSFSHLRAILLAQFFLQKKMEKALKQNGQLYSSPIIKLFHRSSCICIAIAYPSSLIVKKEQILKAFDTIVPGVHEIHDSSYLWYEPNLSYFFTYLEINKLRGKEPSIADLRIMQSAIYEQFLAAAPATPALFWPYNEEESFRQIKFLQSELLNEKDLPHIAIHFREQSALSITFLVFFVMPQFSFSFFEIIKQLPHSLSLFWHFHYIDKKTFPVELGAFSVKVPSFLFEVNNSINLLYARNFVLKHIETLIGPLRDYNGGLFEKQREHFDTIRVHLSSKIAHFDLFAEKLFYSLYPIELRFSFSMEKLHILFTTFSELMQSKETFSIKTPVDEITIVKTANASDSMRFLSQLSTHSNISSHAQLSLGNFHYLCLLNESVSKIKSQLEKISSPKKAIKTLRLCFQEGSLFSLNPSHSSIDMRGRIVMKLLFEGLVRLDNQGKIQMAGAQEISSSNEGFRYTFKLRPSRWSNGESVTAVDYVRAWQYSLKERVSHPEFFVIKNARAFRDMKCSADALGIRALNADTLEIELEWADPQFLNKLSQPCFSPLFGSMQEPKWFNGPYLVREQSAEKLLLERNPYFWDSSRLFFEQIDFSWAYEIEEIYQLFIEGKTDWIGDPLSFISLDIIDKLQADGKLKKQSVNRPFLLFFNTKHSLLSSSAIRQALSLSINRALICNCFFPHSIPAFPFTSDLEKAKFFFEKGLKDLGYTRDTFPPLTLIYSHIAKHEDIALALQYEWQKTLKIDIKIEKKRWSSVRNQLEKGNFEMAGHFQITPNESSLEFLERFNGINSRNLSHWENSHYKQLLLLAKQEKDKRQLENLLKEADEILSNEKPFTSLFKYTHLFAIHPNLDGYFMNQDGSIDFSSSFFNSIISKDVICGQEI